MKKILFAFLLLANAGFAQVKPNWEPMAYNPSSGNPNRLTGNNINGIAQNFLPHKSDRFGIANSANDFEGAKVVENINRTATNISCNNWLNTPSISSSVNIGDLDIPGNQITVEALINRTYPYLPGGFDSTEGDIVSKHVGPNNANYLLRPNHAYITTSDGFFATPDVCDIDLNKTYHVAMVYNGSTLKFYRNGFLLSQVNATGNLFQNDFNTRIGFYGLEFYKTQFIGYINEVRIWNTARSQAELNTWMNASLPNPATQAGLKAYYTFDNLLNKQGNTTYNGVINGNATINQVNPNCTFGIDSCAALTASCTTWLNTPSQPSWVNVGDIDVPGNKLTVEALVNIKGFAPGGSILGLDVVSKHTGPFDVNYLLRADHAELTTTSGFFETPKKCGMLLNKTYHIAMVYDGVTMKYYRNGFLLSQVAVTGNMIQSNLPTAIGFISTLIQPENFIGFINEVRIWNVVRTQSQIRTNMGTSLPNPTTQTGLVAYYTFDNLLNKQGNAIYNGTLVGAAVINQTNPECNFIPDSCNVVVCNAVSSNISKTICQGETFQGYSTAGTYSDLFFTSLGCDSTRILTLTVNPAPQVQTSNNSIVCPGTPVQISTTGAAQYSWTPATGLSSTSIGSPIATPATTTEYIVTGTNANGCSANDTVTITIKPLPVISITNNKTICINKSISLQASGGIGYSWTPAGTLNDATIANPVATPTTNITYTVVVTGANNCTNTDSVKITVKVPASFWISDNQSVCVNGKAQLIATGGTSYLWSPANYLNDATIYNPVATVPASIFFSVLVRDSICNLTSILAVNVTTDRTPPVIKASKTNDIDCVFSNAQLNVSGANIYTWSPALSLSDANIFNPVAIPASTQQYTVLGKDSMTNCQSQDTIIVFVKAPAGPRTFIPNSFTPNGDGKNDCFKILEFGNVKTAEVIIYNRWGNLVFKSKNKTDCWDGFYKGQPAEVGNYVYYIKVLNNCGEEIKKGNLLLLR